MGLAHSGSSARFFISIILVLLSSVGS